MPTFRHIIRYATQHFKAMYDLLCPCSVPSGSGVVRLGRSGSTSPLYSSGRVQIYYLNQWGNICDDAQFGLTEASVICHQLGYTGASSQSRGSLDRQDNNTDAINFYNHASFCCTLHDLMDVNCFK